MTKHHHNRHLFSSVVLAAASSVVLVVLFHIHSCYVTTANHHHHSSELEIMSNRLRRAVTFLPLKDLRYSHAALVGHTWFMSSLQDHHDDDGGVQFQHFPSTSSDERILCLKGWDRHDGARNYYALAWPESLPYNATLAKGLTFVSYNHYDYENIWHGLSAVVPFVAWHLRWHQVPCKAGPDQWVLYHKGEVRVEMSVWLKTLIEATFGGGAPEIEGFEESSPEAAVCFEEAVVMRHNEGGMSRVRRMEVYDLMRCKARAFCNVSGGSDYGFNRMTEIGMTLFMRTGPRSFRNGTAVVGIFETVCAETEGCRLRVAYSNNLTFCEQVKLMSTTDVLISPHGAQLTNMFLMDRNSSVMEFFPKGWLNLAGVGQYVYHWIASWSGMRHHGAWRDPQADGPPCPHSDDDRRCMSFFKNARIGHNETYFSEWARNVVSEVKIRKTEEAISKGNSLSSTTSAYKCYCN